MPIGIGFDIHKLVKGRKLFLGGIEIKYPKGLLGYSDGDAVLHAICDALLGATGKGDIGTYFPDTDPKYKDISSAMLLSNVKSKISKNWRIENIDIIIFAGEPKLVDVKAKMRSSIAEILDIDEEAINIKAKSMNGLGEIGRGKAIGAQAIVSIKKHKK